MIRQVIQHMKHGTLIKTIRKKRYVKKNLSCSDQDPEKYLIGLGKILLGYKMNLKNPCSLNEKLNWCKLHYEHPLMHVAADKIEAKQYVASKGLENILIPTIATYDRVEEIRLESLPNRFVVKNTLDSGGVFVCKDKTRVSLIDIMKKLQVCNKEIIDGKHWALENVYLGKNRIIIEELLDTEDGHAPWDYKFFCFHGEPKFLFVSSDRDTEVCFDFYDIDFHHLDVIQGHPHTKKKIEKPKNYERMLEICRILSEDFPQVRVDLYYENDHIYFGELTFYHFAALTPFKPRRWDDQFGEYFDLSLIKKENIK